MQLKNLLLLVSAARLYSVGVDMEGARETLRKYIDQGFDYGSPEIRQAYSDFTVLRRQFDTLEREHIRLRAE